MVNTLLKFVLVDSFVLPRIEIKATILTLQSKDSKNKHQKSALDDNKMIDDLTSSLP